MNHPARVTRIIPPMDHLEGQDDEEGTHEQTWQTKSDHLLCVIDARRDMCVWDAGVMMVCFCYLKSWSSNAQRP